ncbi:uncharacterized protein SAPINGB_P001309 [Magnusiomyces paraingens]|uniref:Response regulatory domain-containing protein n=1 Tax=Magnusiomyces paraingens TaxID=2606893 RepID=A0A5E8B517_9ASCO|nr:uncharacterized protein SAPINGB_P001309 [Saprochaete ingens]VVT46630.1 unnamed protein product [Saprochaete ingens]
MSTAAAAAASGSAPLVQPPLQPPSSLRIVPGLGSLPLGSAAVGVQQQQQQQQPNTYSPYNTTTLSSNNNYNYNNNSNNNNVNGTSVLQNSASQVRRVWVQRAGHVATSVFVLEHDLVDDLKTLVYQRFPQSIGRALDPADIVVRVRSQTTPVQTRQQSLGIPQARGGRQPRASQGHAKSMSQPNIGLSNRPGSPAPSLLPTGPVQSPQQQAQEDVWVALAPDMRVFDVLEQHFSGSQMPATAAFLIDVPAVSPLVLSQPPIPQLVQQLGTATTSTVAVPATASQPGGGGLQSPALQVTGANAVGLATPTYGFPPLTPVVSAGPGSLNVTPGTPTIMAAVVAAPNFVSSGSAGVSGQLQQESSSGGNGGDVSEESETKDAGVEHHHILQSGISEEIETTLSSGPDSPDFGSSIQSGPELMSNSAQVAAATGAAPLTHTKTDSVGSSASTASGLSFMSGAFGDADDTSTLTPIATLTNKTGSKHGSMSSGSTSSAGVTGGGSGSAGSTKKSGVILIPNKFKAQMGGSAGAGTVPSSGSAGSGKRGSSVVSSGEHGGTKSLAAAAAAQRVTSVSSGNSGPSSPVGARRDHSKRGGGGSIAVATAQAQGASGSNGSTRSFSPSSGRPSGLSRTPSSASLTKVRAKWNSGGGGSLPKTRSSMNLYLQQKGQSSQQQQQQQQQAHPPTTKLLSTYTTVVPQVNVLIVEDNLINMRILERFLRQRSIRSDWAKNGREAIDKWRQGGFHLVLMDIQMPELSGLEATKEIRRLEQANRIGVFTTNESSSSSSGHSAAAATATTSTSVIAPEDILDTKVFKFPVIIVALTASSALSDKTDALAAGCNDYLVKPVNLKWLWQKTIEWGCMQALIDFEGWKHWVSKAPPSISNGESGATTTGSTTSGTSKTAAATATSSETSATSAGLTQGSSSNIRRPTTSSSSNAITSNGNMSSGGSGSSSSNSSSNNNNSPGLGRKKTIDRPRSASRARENRVVSSGGVNRIGSALHGAASPGSSGLSPKLSSAESPGFNSNSNGSNGSINHAVSAPIAIPGRSRSSSSASGVGNNTLGAFPRSSSLLSANGGILCGAVTPAAVSAAVTTTATTTGTITVVASTSSGLNSPFSSSSPSTSSLSATKGSTPLALGGPGSSSSSSSSPLRSPTAVVLARACREAATATGDGNI